jgi:hypothetical protein
MSEPVEITDAVVATVSEQCPENGIHQWKVTSPDGGQWSDLQPTLAGWDQLN